MSIEETFGGSVEQRLDGRDGIQSDEDGEDGVGEEGRAGCRYQCLGEMGGRGTRWLRTRPRPGDEERFKTRKEQRCRSVGWARVCRQLASREGGGQITGGGTRLRRRFGKLRRAGGASCAVVEVSQRVSVVDGEVGRAEGEVEEKGRGGKKSTPKEGGGEIVTCLELRGGLAIVDLRMRIDLDKEALVGRRWGEGGGIKGEDDARAKCRGKGKHAGAAEGNETSTGDRHQRWEKTSQSDASQTPATPIWSSRTPLAPPPVSSSRIANHCAIPPKHSRGKNEAGYEETCTNAARRKEEEREQPLPRETETRAADIGKEAVKRGWGEFPSKFPSHRAVRSCALIEGEHEMLGRPTRPIRHRGRGGKSRRRGDSSLAVARRPYWVTDIGLPPRSVQHMPAGHARVWEGTDDGLHTPRSKGDSCVPEGILDPWPSRATERRMHPHLPGPAEASHVRGELRAGYSSQARAAPMKVGRWRDYVRGETLGRQIRAGCFPWAGPRRNYQRDIASQSKRRPLGRGGRQRARWHRGRHRYAQHGSASAHDRVPSRYVRTKEGMAEAGSGQRPGRSYGVKARRQMVGLPPSDATRYRRGRRSESRENGVEGRRAGHRENSQAAMVWRGARLNCNGPVGASTACGGGFPRIDLGPGSGIEHSSGQDNSLDDGSKVAAALVLDPDADAVGRGSKVAAAVWSRRVLARCPPACREHKKHSCARIKIMVAA
ncbi:hypothetical protein DFH06DRAFT_1150896 [Mycena polygramma]|nr:hypothetical protein DFH06DRAFT_1150896 [Mycena polygramma]